MLIYVVLSNWCENRYFGAYSSVQNARQAILNWVNYGDAHVIDVQDTGDYSYRIVTNEGEYWFVIAADDLDADADVPEPEDDCDYDVGYDPYMGCFSDDC